MRFTRRVAIASFKASIPVLLGYLAMGFAAGVLLGSRTGVSAFWGFITSASSISGTLQFLLVDWFSNQTALITVALVSLSVNLRYALYGLPLLERWKHIHPLLKLYLILTLTDETFALEVENKFPKGEDSVTYCFLISAMDHIYWIIGVIAGTLVGTSIPFNTQGIDFAMTALFIVILLDQLKNKNNRYPAVLGIFGGLAGMLIYHDNMLIPAIIIILALILALRRYLDVERRTVKGAQEVAHD